MESDGINQIWVSDVTCLRVGDGHQYLSLVTDLDSRRIVGYHLCEDLSHRGTLKALEMGLASLPEEAKPIHHSDRESHYASHEYVRHAQAKGLKISMTEVEHCAENALAERMNGILKQEYELDGHFENGEQGRQAVRQAVWLYNEERPHRSLGLKTPSPRHLESGANSLKTVITGLIGAWSFSLGQPLGFQCPWSRNLTYFTEPLLYSYMRRK
ncbi:MAG: transposase [Verrucomicrobiia bacterium]